MENMITGRHDCSNSEWTVKGVGGVKVISNLNSENALTLSDVLPCPLVILKERVPLDLINTVAAESNLPVVVRENVLSLSLNKVKQLCE